VSRPARRVKRSESTFKSSSSSTSAREKQLANANDVATRDSYLRLHTKTITLTVEVPRFSSITLCLDISWVLSGTDLLYSTISGLFLGPSLA
jgi:hypothetical protein